MSMREKSCSSDTFGHNVLSFKLICLMKVLQLNKSNVSLCSSRCKWQYTNWLKKASVINYIFNTLALNFGKCTDNIHLVTDRLYTLGDVFTLEFLFTLKLLLQKIEVFLESFLMKKHYYYYYSSLVKVYCFSFLCCSVSDLTWRSWRISPPNVLCLMYLYCSALCFFFECSCWLVGGKQSWHEIVFCFLVQLICWYWWWLGGRMYDVIYFNAWSDIICTAAKLLHGTSAFSQKSLLVWSVLPFTSFYQTGKNGISA